MNDRKQQNKSRKKNKSFGKGHYRYLIWTLLVLFLLFMFYWLGPKILDWQAIYRTESNVEEAREDWNNYLEEKYEQIKDDDIGGETPYETLRMYIEAVDSGDYELASNYFTVENRQEELESLNNAPQENIETSTELLKQALKENGSYNLDKTSFSVSNPIFVKFVKYPSNVWKIREI